MFHRRIYAAALFAALVLRTAPAGAINWEGHDDWFLTPLMIEDFTRSLPAPLANPMPTCADRAAAVRANSSEQIPLPGYNCRRDSKPNPPLERNN
jgi:hypothetical protein